ncbi:permease prefix domain 1-containing protein [Kribbella deserti]|uniref:Permease prefix domain 1-containing protein n=1 Tax=Kribbella deserti TaxID=1926257 RepID=A0ABV6QK36_9ACTN
MARTELRAQNLGENPVDAYIARLDAALLGPRRKKADLLTEARDGLVDATEALEAEGLSRAEAERRAIDEFGELREILPDYRAELGYAQGRRTAVLMAAAIIIQPIVWLEGTWQWNRDAYEVGPVHSWLNRFVEQAGMAAFVLAVLALLATGIGLRYPAVRASVTRLTGLAGLLSCGVIGGLGAAMAVIGAQNLVGALVSLMWVSLFVLLPLSAVAVSARRCLRLA